MHTDQYKQLQAKNQAEDSLEFDIHQLDVYFKVNSSVSISSVTVLRGLF